MMITTEFNDLLEVVEREEADGTFPSSKKTFGLFLPHLRDIRKSQGISPADIADFLDVGESTVGFYDAGKHGCKSIERAQKIAQVLGCSLEDLTTYENLRRYHSSENVATNNFSKKPVKVNQNKSTDNKVNNTDTITSNPTYMKSRLKKEEKTNEERLTELTNTLEDILSRLERVEGEKKSIWQRLFG